MEREAVSGVCVYCGCTEQRACLTDGQPCWWINRQRTVCSAPGCIEKFGRDLFHLELSELIRRTTPAPMRRRA